MPSPRIPDPASPPTADAAECWLREVNPLLDAVARYLSPDAIGSTRPCDGPPRRAMGADDDDAALAEYARAHAALRSDRPVARFAALTACHVGRADGSGATRLCGHAHVELLIAEEAGAGPGGPRYAVRVVNVDLPRWRHRDAFIAPAPTWPDRGEAAAEGLRLARERWGEVAVVHSTPCPDRADTATDGGRA